MLFRSANEVRRFFDREDVPLSNILSKSLQASRVESTDFTIDDLTISGMVTSSYFIASMTMQPMNNIERKNMCFMIVDICRKRSEPIEAGPFSKLSLIIV